MGILMNYVIKSKQNKWYRGSIEALNLVEYE